MNSQSSEVQIVNSKYSDVVPVQTDPRLIYYNRDDATLDASLEPHLNVCSNDSVSPQ
jgi:hypothetical protein